MPRASGDTIVTVEYPANLEDLTKNIFVHTLFCTRPTERSPRRRTQNHQYDDVNIPDRARCCRSCLLPYAPIKNEGKYSPSVLLKQQRENGVCIHDLIKQSTFAGEENYGYCAECGRGLRIDKLKMVDS